MMISGPLWVCGAQELWLLLKEHLRCGDVDAGLVLEDLENIASRLRLHPNDAAASAFFTRNRLLLQAARSRLQNLQLAVVTATSSEAGRLVRGKMLLAALPLSDEMRSLVEKSRARPRSESPEERRDRGRRNNNNNKNYNNHHNSHRHSNTVEPHVRAVNQKCRFLRSVCGGGVHGAQETLCKVAAVDKIMVLAA